MKEIPGFDGYVVDEYANVYNQNIGLLLNNFVGSRKKGYLSVMLRQCRGKQISRMIHTLVLEAFVGPRPKGYHGCHMDGDVNNNHLSNLRWLSAKENMSHKKIHGTENWGERNFMTKLSEKQIIKMRKEYVRKSLRISNLKELGKKYGMNYRVVYKIVIGESWSHIKEGISPRAEQDPRWA